MLHRCVDIIIAITRIENCDFVVALSPIMLQPAGCLSPRTVVEDSPTLGN